MKKILDYKDLYYLSNQPKKVTKKINDRLELLQKSMAGDLVLEITPGEKSTPEIGVAWTRTVIVKLVEALGNVHNWYDGTLGISIADTSVLGTASIPAVVLDMTSGIAEVEVSGDATDWLGGTKQVETLTIQSVVDGDGDLDITITSADLAPDYAGILSVTTGMTAIEVAGDVESLLSGVTSVTDVFDVSSSGADVILTKKLAEADDITLAMTVVKDADGSPPTTFTDNSASIDTESGVVPETNTLTIDNLEVMGYTVTGGTSIETFNV